MPKRLFFRIFTNNKLTSRIGSLLYCALNAR